MGHIVDPENTYGVLQKQLSRSIQGATESPTLIKILRMLFSPEDAELATHLPHNLTPVDDLARVLKMPADELNDRLTEMAGRGIVFDLELKGRRYVTLPPVVIGFFEFTFMRARPDMPMRELAELFEEYFYENNGAFCRTLHQGETQMFRSLVREEALPQNDHTEVLDWERASQIISSESTFAVGICQCQHSAQHLGLGCDKPPEVCLSMGFAAESLSRNGIARSISQKEAMDVLARSKEAGLAQTGDNVQQKVSFICNCCGCCCHLMRGIRTLGTNQGVVTSNWIMDVDRETCNGCGICAKACPIGAIGIAKEDSDNSKKKWAVCNAEMCLGCGVCVTACKTGAATMRSRPQRILVPETVFEQRVAMAIERGKLADLLFDDQKNLSHQALARIISIIEKSPPYKAAMARQSIKSAFVNGLVKGARKKAGDLGELFR